MIKYYYSIALGVLLFSCGSEHSASSNGHYSLENYKEGDVVFNLDEYTSFHLRSIRYLYDQSGEEFLYLLNDQSNSIYRYSLADSNYTHRVKFPIDGPLGVGQLNGFDIKGADSLFLLARYDYKLSLVVNPLDSVRKVTVYRLIDSKADMDMTAYADTYAPMYLEGDTLNILSVPFFYVQSKSYYEAGNCLVRLNLRDSSISKVNLYSDLYKNRYTPYYARAGTAKNKAGEVIISLPADPYLYRYDSHYNWIGKSLSVTPTVPEIKAFRGEFIMEEEMIHMYQNARYISIQYDPFREVYYRIAELPNRQALSKGDRKYYSFRSFAVIIYDKDLNIIGEQILPPHYMIDMLFVGKKGLYLGQPVGTSTGVDENKVRFVCFQLTNKNE